MKIDYFTEGIGRVIASGYAMRNCISFLKSVYPKRFRHLKTIGVKFNNVVNVNWQPKDKWFENKIDCPNCADQASIAAPGQTTLCKTHSDERHYADMKEFFDSQLSNLTIQAHMPFCSRCGNDNPSYIGFIQGAFTMISHSFCIDCRDELTLKKNAAIAAQERIGA